MNIKQYRDKYWSQEELGDVKHYNGGYVPKFTDGLDWNGTDTRENFVENYKKIDRLKPQDRETLEYYSKYPIKYYHNTNCFREAEINEFKSPVNLAIGCSFTYGIGVHLENTWPYFFKKFTGEEIFNAGAAGSGPMTHFRVLESLISKLKIKRVLHLNSWRHAFRFEFRKEKGSIQTLWPHNAEDYVTNLPFFFENVYNDTNVSAYIYAYKCAIKYLCKENNIEYFSIDDPAVISLSNWPKITSKPPYKGRDLSHPGPYTQQMYANNFINQIGLVRNKNLL